MGDGSPMKVGNGYISKLCDERHTHIDQTLGGLDERIKKVENRFIAILTALCLNLLGVLILVFRTVGG